MGRWYRLAAYAASALILLVIGAALRPVILPEQHTAAPILTDTEIGFAQDMTAHHQQALIMVQRLDPGADPMVLRLAQQIDQSQRMEIGVMLGWLRLADASPMTEHPMAWMHGAPATSPEGSMTMVPSATTMPGMASQAELDGLAAARGQAASVLFLQLMYRHHLGGIAMARAADQQITSGAVKQEARAMITEQSEDIGLILALLSQLGAAPLP
ncbi:DUF305 domain-containing protein [Nocardia alni]|uniref:DUF305 domain-containing protein n=1 Tax=Nocardia alni TaxID=2815723 RepID=UPI001C24CEDE|nr:DUF305 domain-containing protein [Nocardia alni]